MLNKIDVVISCLFFQRPQAKMSLTMNKDFIRTLVLNTRTKKNIKCVFTFNAVTDWYYDELIKEIDKYLTLKEQTVIRRSVMNMKFSRSHNYAIQMFDSKYVCLVNDDIEIPESSHLWLEQCLSFLDSNDKIGTVTPVTVYPNNTFYCAGASGNGAHFLQYQNDGKGVFDKPRRTEWNNMSCILIKKKLFDEYGLFLTDINHEHFHSDREWCTRISKEGGYEHWVHPVRLIHKHKYGYN